MSYRNFNKKLINLKIDSIPSQGVRLINGIEGFESTMPATTFLKAGLK